VSKFNHTGGHLAANEAAKITKGLNFVSLNHNGHFSSR
jgi:hypothetical protein